MPVLDPSGFQISVVVRSGGKSYPLWMSTSFDENSSVIDIDSADVLFTDVPIVESVQVDIGMGLIGKVSIEIAATYDLGLKLLESAIFAIGSVIDVQIGYPRISRFLPWFSTMASKPSININPDDGLTATLNGEGGAFAAARAGSSESFSGTYASIIEAIAAQESNRWNLDMPTAQEVGADDALYVDRGSISQGSRTDWMFVQYICRQANYDAWIMPDPDVRGANLLRLRRRADSMAETPRYTFVSRGQCDFINTYPILSFESSAEGVWMPPGSRDVHVTDVNIVTRETAPEEVMTPEDTDVAATPGSETAGPGAEESEGTVVATEPVPRDDRGAGRRIAHPTHSPESAIEVMRSMVTESRQAGGLNANFTTIGMPDIFPGEAVKLVGLGIFSGNYIVESLSHTAAPGDWSMNVKLLGDGVDARGMDTAISRLHALYNSEDADEQEEAEGGGVTDVVPTPAE